jgi:hypothetical protein
VEGEDPPEPGEPPGRHLAAFIAARAEARGIAVSPVEYLGFAYGFRCDIGERRFYVTVGLVEDGVREWLLVIDPWLSFWQRLFGASDREELRRLARTLDAVLKGSERFGEIRWYDERTWDAAAETEWSPEPCPGG